MDVNQSVITSVTVADIKEYVSRFNAIGTLNGDEGLLFGRSDANVMKIMLCWMADVAAIKHATQIGADTIIAHETLFYPSAALEQGGTLDFLSWKTNNERVKLLAAGGITVIRVHTTMDYICIFDDFAVLLELGEPVIDAGGLVKVFDIEPIPYGMLIERVKKAVNMPHVRVTDGDRGRLVHRVGLPWGGLGLHRNAHYVQKLIHHGCDVLISGESCNYGFRFAVDAGLDVIETSHEVSENPGIRHFSRTLAEAFP